MNDTSLLDILKISAFEAPLWKLSLSMHPTEDKDIKFIDSLLETGIASADHSFAFNSHQSGRRNYKVGDRVVCFVKLQKDQWLLHMVGEVTSVPEEVGACGFKPLEDRAHLFGRLVAEFKKGNTFSRYVFKLDKFLADRPEARVAEIWRSELEPFSRFEGYNNVNWSFSKLLNVLESPRFLTTREKLADMKGVYLLADQATGKLYVGSAYGKEGFAQRWSCYVETQTGGNKGLKELYDSLGPEYFKANFTFSLLEWFDHKTPDKDVLERECWWKEVLLTRKFGYNCN